MRTTVPSPVPTPTAPSAARGRRRARLAVGAVGAGLVLAVGAAPAGAHVEAQPTSVEAGSLTTISLGWHHGCAGSPTRQVSVRLPADAAEVRLLAPEGWDAAGPDDGGVATFTARPGAEIDDHAEGSVGIELRVPDAGDGRLVLPTVQTCVDGEEPWIEEAVGDEEPDKPAPVVEVLGVTGDAAGASHETEGNEHTTTTVQETTTTTAEDAAAVEGDAAAAVDDDDDGGATPLIIGAGLGIAAGVGAGLVLQRRRRAR